MEAPAQRRGVGSFLFRQLIAEARAKGYRKLRITTGAQNVAMRALADKFGAHLTFSQGESTGTIDVIKHGQPQSASVPFGVRQHARGCTRDYGFQSRILADAVQN